MVSRRKPRRHHHPADGRTTRSSACYRQLVMGIVFNKLETTVEQTHVRCLATVNHRRPSRPAARTTRQRLAVTDLLSELHGFRSAQQIHATLQERGDNIGLATIYRPLALMANSGDVDVLTHEEARYSSTSPAPSPHRPTGAPSTARSSTSTSRPMRPKSSSQTLTSSSPTCATPAPLQSEPDSQNRPGAQRSGPVSCLVPDEADVSVANEPGRRHRPLTVS